MLTKRFIVALTILGLGLNLHAEKPVVSSGQYYGGAVVGTLFGLGIGHAIQERYGEMGWIFTVGEVGSLAIMGGAIGWIFTSLRGRSWREARSADFPVGGFVLLLGGAMLKTGFRIWEIVDVWAGATPEDSAPKKASQYLNQDETRFAGATELGVASLSIDLISFRF